MKKQLSIEKFIPPYFCRQWQKKMCQLRALKASARPSGQKNCRNGFEEDFKIKPQGPGVNILQIKSHPLVEIHFISSRDLPETGDTRLHTQAATVPALIPFGLIRDRWPGANQTHLPSKPIP